VTKTIPCTPEKSVIVITTQTWYKVRKLLLERAQGHALAQLVQALRYKPEGPQVTGIFHSSRTMAPDSTKK
jgi:hypothetical protein